MRIFLTILIIFFGTSIAIAQAYDGAGDQKFQIGVNLQDNGAGIMGSYDLGIGEHISVGVSSSYLIGVEPLLTAGFVGRFDVRARANMHLGSVMGLGGGFDIYPGLDMSLKNFGFHAGARYFFSDGFGVFAEVGHPIARYKSKERSPAEELHNQLVINFGLSLNFL